MQPHNKISILDALMSPYVTMGKDNNDAKVPIFRNYVIESPDIVCSLVVKSGGIKIFPYNMNYITLVS